MSEAQRSQNKYYSYSKIDTFMSCPWKFYLRYKLGIYSRKKAAPLALGSCMAAGLAAFRTENSWDAASNAFMEIWAEEGKNLLITKAEDPLRSVTRGLEILKAYTEHYVKEPDQMVMPEIYFEVPLYDNFIFEGYLDGIIRLPDKDLAIIEDKTTISSLTDYYFGTQTDSYQTKWYMMAAMEHGLFEIGKKKNVPKCLINGIQIHKDKENLERRIIFYMNPVLRQFKEDLIEWVRHIESVELFPKADFSECNKYGGCEYLPLRGSQGKTRERILAANYYQPTPEERSEMKRKRRARAIASGGENHEREKSS